MQKKEVNNFKEFFLLEFTRCLIEESVNIVDIVKISDEKIRDDVRSAVKKKSIKSIMSGLNREKKERGRDAVLLRKKRVKGRFPDGVFKRGIKRLSRAIKKPVSVKISSKGGGNRGVPGRLKIPEPKFSQRLQYIKPVPTSQGINLGKLNDLIVSPLVRQVDCNGEGSEILVRTNRVKKTNIVLREDEINNIIQNFSVASRIPVMDGVFRVAVGKVELVAMVSESIGSKFIIRKIRQNNRFGVR